MSTSITPANNMHQSIIRLLPYVSLIVSTIAAGTDFDANKRRQEIRVAHNGRQSLMPIEIYCSAT